MAITVEPTIPAELPPETDLGEVFRGDSLDFTVRCLWSDGTPVDLTGGSVWATFKADPGAADGAAPGFQRSTLASGVTILPPPAAGLVLVQIGGPVTAGLTDTTQMFWDVQFLTADGRTGTAARGTIVWVADITRATG